MSNLIDSFRVFNINAFNYLLYDLKNNDLLNLESGEGISIVILEENPNNIKIKLEVEAFSYGADFSSKKEFVKWR